MKELTHYELDEFIIKNEKGRYIINKTNNYFSIFEDYLKISGFHSKKCDRYTIETPVGELDLVVEFCTNCGPDEFDSVMTLLDPSKNLLKAFFKT